MNVNNSVKEQDPAYHAVLKDFRGFASNRIDHYKEEDALPSSSGSYGTLAPKYDLNRSVPDPVCISNEMALLCAQLSNWIYIPDEIPMPSPSISRDDSTAHWHYKKVVIAKSTQIAQWSLLQHSSEPKNAYLVFKGTDADKIFGILRCCLYIHSDVEIAFTLYFIANTDILADSSMIPMPIWVHQDADDVTSKMDKNRKRRLHEPLSSPSDNPDDAEWQFCAHSGILATLMRDFHRIWNTINRRIAYIDNLYVCGHSLGGGLAVLFGLQSIIHHFLPSHKTMQIITFGCPAVISYEHEFHSLSRHAQRVLSRLQDICHCVVNRFDPIPRIPFRVEWMMTVIPYGLSSTPMPSPSLSLSLFLFLLSPNISANLMRIPSNSSPQDNC